MRRSPAVRAARDVLEKHLPLKAKATNQSSKVDADEPIEDSLLDSIAQDDVIDAFTTAENASRARTAVVFGATYLIVGVGFFGVWCSSLWSTLGGLDFWARSKLHSELYVANAETNAATMRVMSMVNALTAIGYACGAYACALLRGGRDEAATTAANAAVALGACASVLWRVAVRRVGVESRAWVIPVLGVAVVRYVVGAHVDHGRGISRLKASKYAHKTL